MHLRTSYSERIFTRMLQSNWISVLAVYLIFGAVVARTLALEAIRPRLPLYLGLELLFLVSFTVILWRPGVPTVWLKAYFVFQTINILFLLSLRPQFDFVISLFIMLCFQAGLLLAGRTRWVWIGLFAGLAVIPLIFFIGLAEGLEKGLYPMVGCIIFSAYVIVNQEIETARLRSQVMITKLQETRQQLELRASHIEEIAAIEERNQLAREIHDSVSQTLFSIELNIRLAEILLERDPAQVLSQLEKLKILTQQALAQMRSLIAYLRPRSNEMLQGDQLTHHAGQEGLADQQIA